MDANSEKLNSERVAGQAGTDPMLLRCLVPSSSWSTPTAVASLGGRLFRGSSLEWLRHCLAATILLAFAASHFAAFAVARPSQLTLNTVFPLFTNRTMYLLAGILELTTALVCLKKRGLELANVAILIFILGMLWYRWALFYTGGGNHCDCLGIMGAILHLNKTQEKIVPLFVLVFLWLTLLPWLVRSFTEIVRNVSRNPTSVHHVAFLVIAFQCQRSYGQQTFQITGQYDTEHFDPLTGEVVTTNFDRHVAFICTLSGDAWSIYVTNIATTGEGLKNRWEGLAYDGTNTYTLLPIYRDGFGRLYPVRATVSPTPLFLRDYSEPLDIDVIWMTYCLCPRRVTNSTMITTNGLVDLPLPWRTARVSGLSHGFEWKITPSADGRFVSECCVLRNTNLDLRENDEILRPDMIDINQTLSVHNVFIETLDLRHRLPQGHVEAVYKCLGWYTTNGVLLPNASEEVRYSVGAGTNATFRVRVNASAVIAHEGLEQLIPMVVETTFVADYRYRRADQGKISPCVEYVLDSGSSWKAGDDPELLAQADQRLKQRMSFSQWGYATGIGRSYFTWLLLAFLLAPVVILCKSKHRACQTNKGKK